MFLAHSIRLRDPWQRAATDEGVLRWSRSFHRPTGLEADDDLWLVISGLPPDAAVAVNGHAFDPPEDGPSTGLASAADVATAAAEPDGLTDADPSAKLPARYNLTEILADRNRIEIRVPVAAAPPAGAAFPYDVRLAIMARS